MIGMSTITAQAPSRNFVAARTTSTIPVTTAPKALMVALRCQPGVFKRRHRWTIPSCESVNEVNTPTA